MKRRRGRRKKIKRKIGGNEGKKGKGKYYDEKRWERIRKGRVEKGRRE